MSSDTKLRVIIIGSGLAGLIVARILREHYHVAVYERGDAAVATGGQGIIIAPNGVKILDTIGYDRDRAGAVPIHGIRTYDKEGNIGEDVDMDLKSQFGADTLAQKRSDFWDELLQLATAPSEELCIQGDPAEMVFDTAAVGLDPDQGRVTLSNGLTASGDIIIVSLPEYNYRPGGDESYVAKKTGLTCYRVAVSVDDATRALGDHILPHWWDSSTSQNHSSVIYAADGSARMVTTYPIRNGTYFNLSCILRTQESTKSTAESWNAEGDVARMVKYFGDFHEPLRLKLGNTVPQPKFKVWELQDLEPLPTWTRRRAMLIRDAAHAMTPMQGQGANMSVEDAESFRLLAPGSRRQDVPGILKLAESVRRPRVAHILAGSGNLNLPWAWRREY